MKINKNKLLSKIAFIFLLSYGIIVITQTLYSGSLFINNFIIIFFIIILFTIYLVLFLLFELRGNMFYKYKADKSIIQFLGRAKKHVKGNVIRSSDNKRQFRVTHGLERTETFWHFEYLADDGVTIIEETTQLASYKYFEDEESHRLFHYHFVALVKASDSKGRVAHYWVDKSDNRQNKSKLLGRPHFLFLRSENLGYSLFHLDQSGSYQGSTWHPTLEEAREQASYEYEKLLGQWHLLPSKVRTVQDVVEWIEKRGDWARKREGWF